MDILIHKSKDNTIEVRYNTKSKETAMPTAKVTSKGQITIPAEVRNALELKPGTKVVFYPDADGGFVMRASTGSIMDLRGILAGLDVPKTDEEMN